MRLCGVITLKLFTLRREIDQSSKCRHFGTILALVWEHANRGLED